MNQLPFLEGKQKKSNRESVVFFTGQSVAAVKWMDWKFHYAYTPVPRQPEPPLMRLFHLRSDPKEESDVKDANPWALSAFDKIVADWMVTTVRYPNVPQGAPDPYLPPRP
ncbi:MAG: hypothetical protein O2973_03825 [Gemmatimonadetes bacterium]|nr:hypothetical protein [Gemmatimonadota bacterium]